MKTINLFENLSEDAIKIFSQFIDINPVGSIVLNTQYEIVYINDQMKQYFEGEIDLTGDFFGNIFGCNQVEGSTLNCGTVAQCVNCNLRSKVVQCLETTTTVRNILWSNNFIIKGEKVLKWFDVTLVPLMFGHQMYIWVSMIDLTELMRYKIDYEMNHILSDEELIQEKNRFHESVMNSFKVNCQLGSKAYIVLIDLKLVKSIQEKFGSLWKNDYVVSVHQYLKELLTLGDLMCHYSTDQFMLFLPCKGQSKFEKIMNALNDFESKLFGNTDLICTRTIKLEVISDFARHITEADQFHLEYFNMITKLELLDENSVFELKI